MDPDLGRARQGKAGAQASERALGQFERAAIHAGDVAHDGEAEARSPSRAGFRAGSAC
jgi:hypothetical protein